MKRLKVAPMKTLMWRSRLYRRLWYWYVFKYQCPKPNHKTPFGEW